MHVKGPHPYTDTLKYGRARVNHHVHWASSLTMSTLSELSISGIRAFDNHDAQTLVFNTPLTLICGANGVGKTTVIECLRYATTGDLPPNSRGGAFIHDPKMSSKSTVKAQVRLKFRDQKHRPMQVARSMQLSISKKNVYSTKTLEGYLVADVEGANRPQGSSDFGIRSNRHLDLNASVPQALGIPPAILNYVVFCHQEDSQWPLAEASQVKKRFDEIFEATRYTKALDSLKTMRRDFVGKNKLNEQEVNFLKEDEERAKEKLGQIQSYEETVKKLSDECATIRKEHSHYLTELGNAIAQRQFLQQLEYITHDLQSQWDRASQDINIIRGDMNENLENFSEEQLKSQLETADSYQNELSEQLKSYRESLAAANKDIEATGSQLSRLTNQQGRIQELLKTHERQVKHRSELADGPWTNEWTDAKKREVELLKFELEQTEVYNRQQEKILADALNSHEANRLQIRQETAEINGAIQKFDTKISSLRSKLDNPDFTCTSEGTESSLQTRIDDLNSQLDATVQSQKEFDRTENLSQAQKAVREMEARAEDARKLLQATIKSADALNRLNFLRDNQRDLEFTRANLKTELVEASNKQGLEDDFRDHIKTQKSEIDLLKTEISKLQSQMDTNDTMTKQCNGNLSRLENQRSELLTELGRLNFNDDFITFEKRITEAEDELMEATEQEEQLKFAHSFFNRALSMAERADQSICLLCEHHNTPEEASSLVKKLKDKITAFSISPEEAQKESQEKRNSLVRLREIEPLFQELKSLNTQISQLQNDKSLSLKPRSNDLRLELDRKSQTYQALQNNHAHLIDIFDPLLARIDRNAEECSTNLKKLQLEESLIVTGTEDMSPQQATSNLEHAEAALKDSRIHLEKTSEEERMIQTQLYQLTNAVKELKLHLSEQQQKKAQKQRIIEDIEEAEKEQQYLRNKVCSADARIPALDDQIGQVQTELASLKFRSAQAEREIANKRNISISLLEKVEQLTLDIDTFISDYGKDPLANLQSEIDNLESQLEGAKSNTTNISSQIDELVAKQSNSGTHHRNIRDTIKIKQLGDRLVELKEKHQRAELELIETRNKLEYDDWELQINELQNRVDTLDRDASAKTGESKAITAHIALLRHELDTTYKNTHQNFMDALGKVETNQGVIEDLEKYVKTMDAAIMRYHSNKMAQINSLLDQMWRQTYTGTDIDTILIRSESDVGTNSARANYNYRVCMVKRDTELDMRGRCSAGQKVLACIIIRMVLVESFGPRSGLIVLDEPTTNLDVQNISALAQSLNEIIGSRSLQRNFQLIVITHDEHFLSLMNPADFCEDYYLIKRDSRQLSRIERKPISRLGSET